MKNRRRAVVLGVIASLGVPVAQAQLGGLGGLLGGGKAKPSDGPAPTPGDVEGKLKQVIERTSFASGKLAEALGIKESAAKSQQIAQGIASGSVGLSDATSAVSESCDTVTREMERRQKEGQKLDAKAAAVAADAVKPAIDSYYLWKEAYDGGMALRNDRAVALKARSLLEAVPKVPPAGKSSAQMINTGIAFLAFSGADTSSLKAAAEKSVQL